MNFSDRHVIVTGGAGSLGIAIIQLLSDLGASCSVPYFDESEEDAFELKLPILIHTQRPALICRIVKCENRRIST